MEFDRRAKLTWLACTCVFAWHSLGARAWRKRVGELGAALGVEDIAGIRRKLDAKWAYRLREAITLGTEEDGQVLIQLWETAGGNVALSITPWPEPTRL